MDMDEEVETKCVPSWIMTICHVNEAFSFEILLQNPGRPLFSLYAGVISALIDSFLSAMASTFCNFVSFVQISRAYMIK